MYPIIRMQHAGKFNMLFADGHGASVKTNILFGADPDYRRRWNHSNEP